MRCPIHKANKMLKCKWEPPIGLDPKMTRHACLDCSFYWSKVPNVKPRRLEDFLTGFPSPSNSLSLREEEKRGEKRRIE